MRKLVSAGVALVAACSLGCGPKHPTLHPAVGKIIAFVGDARTSKAVDDLICAAKLDGWENLDVEDESWELTASKEAFGELDQKLRVTMPKLKGGSILARVTITSVRGLKNDDCFEEAFREALELCGAEVEVKFSTL